MAFAFVMTIVFIVVTVAAAVMLFAIVTVAITMMLFAIVTIAITVMLFQISALIVVKERSLVVRFILSRTLMRSVLKMIACFKTTIVHLAHLLVEFVSEVELTKTNDGSKDDEESNLFNWSVVFLPVLEFCLS